MPAVNLVDEYWDVDGTSLHTYAAAIGNLGGPFSGVPELRGDNVRTPYRPGEIWRPKVAGARVVTLAIVVSDRLDDGTAADDPVYQLGANYRALRRLLWREGEQFTLTKRWRKGTETLGVPDLSSASALAQFVGGIDPVGESRAAVTFTVDLFLADPFFYGALDSTAVPLATPTTVTNPGDARARTKGLAVTFTGPLTNPTLTNSTPTPDVAVSLGLTIAGGDSVVLNLDDYTATRTSDGANVIGSVSHSGSRHWLELLTGTNSLTLTASAGTGSATVAFSPPYL